MSFLECVSRCFVVPKIMFPVQYGFPEYKYTELVFWRFYIGLPENERGALSVEINRFGRQTIEAQLKQLHPEWDETDLKMGVLRQLYQSDFSSEEFEEIAQSYMVYLQSKFA